MNLPNGFRQKLIPLFDQSADPKNLLAKAREFAEQMIIHLKQIAPTAIEIRQVDSSIEKLKSSGIIDRDVAPYFYLWWNISCLGAHFQPDSAKVKWDRHLRICREAILICVEWYTSKFPPLCPPSADDPDALASIQEVIGVDILQLEATGNAQIDKSLENSDCIVLFGQPWAGKTSIAAKTTLYHISEGYIPIVIQENTLITSLPNDGAEGWHENARARSSRVAVNAQLLNQIISTNLLYGNSFILFLDDPFGHRRLLRNNPLTSLPLYEWLELAKNSNNFGSLKIIISTPERFLDEIESLAGGSGKTNPILSRNRALLTESNRIFLSPSKFPVIHLSRIVSNCAIRHGCLWVNQVDKVRFVSDEIASSGFGFDYLYLFCRKLKSSGDDEFLATAQEVMEIKNTIDSINSAPVSEQLVLLAALIGESITTVGREFTFQTQIEFGAVVDAVKHGNECFASCDKNSSSDWIIKKSLTGHAFGDFPVMAHPEVRDSVCVLAKGIHRQSIHNAIINICGLNGDYLGPVFAQWESVHILCNMSEYLDPLIDESIRRVFTPMAQTDIQNILYAVLHNWTHVSESSLREDAMGFLRSIPFNDKSLNRPFIWEAVQIWTDLGPDIRELVLKQTCTLGKDDELRPAFNEHTTLTFVAAGLAYYDEIKSASRQGCSFSEDYLKMQTNFLQQIASKSKPSLYTSMRNDGLFSTPGQRHDASAVLAALKRIADINRSLDHSDSLYRILAD